MSVEICIVLRASPDWAGMSREAFEEQSRHFCRSIGRREDFIVDVSNLWDATFAIPYQEVRARIKRIAQCSLEQWKKQPSVIIGRPDAFSSKCLYLFTDDDDWFLPDLEMELEASGFQAQDCVVWGSAVLHNCLLRELAVHCHSNNYGATASLMKSTDDAWTNVFHHGGQATVFLRASNVLLIPRYLSVKNTRPGSTALLEQRLASEFSRKTLLDMTRAYVAALDPDRLFAHRVFDASRKQVTMMKAVYEELLETARGDVS